MPVTSCFENVSTHHLVGAVENVNTRELFEFWDKIEIGILETLVVML